MRRSSDSHLNSAQHKILVGITFFFLVLRPKRYFTVWFASEPTERTNFHEAFCSVNKWQWEHLSLTSNDLRLRSETGTARSATGRNGSASARGIAGERRRWSPCTCTASSGWKEITRFFSLEILLRGKICERTAKDFYSKS